MHRSISVFQKMVLSINNYITIIFIGHLQFAIFDGKQIQTSTDRRRRFDNNQFYDFRACVSAFRLTITVIDNDIIIIL
jgi:hypothetical protein